MIQSQTIMPIIWIYKINETLLSPIWQIPKKTRPNPSDKNREYVSLQFRFRLLHQRLKDGRRNATVATSHGDHPTRNRCHPNNLVSDQRKIQGWDSDTQGNILLPNKLGFATRIFKQSSSIIKSAIYIVNLENPCSKKQSTCNLLCLVVEMLTEI